MGAMGSLAGLAGRQHLTAFPALRGPLNLSERGKFKLRNYSLRGSSKPPNLADVLTDRRASTCCKTEPVLLQVTAR